MTKHEFLETLTKALRKAPVDVIAEIRSDFEEHFEAGILEGKSEPAIAEALGDPNRIAKLYFADDAVKRARQKADHKSVFSMVLAILRFKLGGGLTVAFVYLTCLLVALCIFLSAFSLFLIGFGLAALAVASAIKLLWHYFLLYIIAFFFLASAGGLTFNGGKAFYNSTIKKMPLFAERMMGHKRNGGNKHA